MDIGERILLCREDRRLSRAQIAARIGISEASLRKIESGETRSPTFAHGVELAAALGVWPDELALPAPMRSPITVRLADALVEVRFRVRGATDHGAVLRSLRQALARIEDSPPDRLEALESHLRAALAEVERMRD